MIASTLALAILLSGVRVIDGDTIDVRGERVRILNIDTPERGDRARCSHERVLAERASRALRSRLRAARDLQLQRDGRDSYGRTLAIVRLDGRDVGEDLSWRLCGALGRGSAELVRGLSTSLYPPPSAKRPANYSQPPEPEIADGLIAVG